MHQAQGWDRVCQGIDRLRQFVKRNPKDKLTTLLHHVNVDSLRAAFFVLKSDAAPGIANRMTRFLKRVREQLIRRMHQPVEAVGRWLGQVLKGWLNYYAVPTSMLYLKRCLRHLLRIRLLILRRRSQRDKTSKEDMIALREACWPELRIRHPWPDKRFAVMRANAKQGRSRLR